MWTLHATLVLFTSFSGLRDRTCGATNDARQFAGKGFYFNDQQLFGPIAQLMRRSENPTELVGFVRANPKSELADEALLMAGTHLSQEGRAAEALALLDQVLRDYPASAHADLDACFLLSVMHFKPEGVISRCRYVAEHPNFSSDIALLKKASILVSLGKEKKATDLLVDYANRLAVGRWAEQDAAERARQDLQEPNRLLWRPDEQIFLKAARLLYEQERYREAIAVLDKATSAFFSSQLLPLYYDLLANCHQRLNNTQEERQALERLLALLKTGTVEHTTSKGQLLRFQIPVELRAPKTRLAGGGFPRWNEVWTLFARTPEDVERRLSALRSIPREGEQESW